MYGSCWRIVAVLTEIIWNTLNTVLYCGVQIEHQHYLNWRHSDGTTIQYCLLVNDKKQNSVQSCCISLCTQQSQWAGKFFCHWDAQGWFLYSHVYVYCKLQNYSLYSILVCHCAYSVYMYLQKTSFTYYTLKWHLLLAHYTL